MTPPRALVTGAGRGIGASIGDPTILQPATQVLPNGTYGAYSICSQLQTNAGIFGALFGAGVLGWGAGWIGSLTGQTMQ